MHLSNFERDFNDFYSNSWNENLMLFTTMKAAYLFGEENTVHLLCTLDDLVRLDLLNVIIMERDQIFCVEKYSYKARVSWRQSLFLNGNGSGHPRKVKYEDDAHKEKVGFCGNRKFMIHQSDLGKILERLPRFKKGDHFVIEITGRLRKQLNITLSELQRSQPNILVKRPKEKLRNKFRQCGF